MIKNSEKRVKQSNFQFLRDPIVLCRAFWPHENWYQQQKDVLYSIWHNKLTICIAGNMLGKDWLAARACLVFFLTRSPCRVITTSVDWTQLQGVLWGEIMSAIQTSVIPLDSKKGGPLFINDLRIRKVFTTGPKKGQIDGLSYLIGRQAKKGEGMLGHHIAETGDGIPRTLFVGDEASSLDDEVTNKAETWADRLFLFGNPYPCSNRFFKESEAGDLASGRRVKYWEGITLEGGKTDHGKTVEHMLRKVVRIRCQDSPNVRLAEAELAAGGEPSGEMIVPGVMSYWKYTDRRKTWDKVKQCIQLDARFWTGSEQLLFPPDWLNKSEEYYDSLRSGRRMRTARSIGCDPGEGDAETAWYVIDDDGILEEVAQQTPDTSVIRRATAMLIRKWNIPPEMVMFDAGGGGKQIADEMRNEGMNVKTVRFGESVTPDPKRGMTSVERMIEQKEERYVYLNRRAQMYGYLSSLVEPRPVVSPSFSVEIPNCSGIDYIPGDNLTESVPIQTQSKFGIPSECTELRRQLALFPRLLDGEGRLWLPPKSKKKPDSKEKTLIEIIGCSPDRADALVVALYCRDFAPRRPTAGAG